MRAYPDDPTCRQIQDPIDGDFWWRCYDLQVQFRYVEQPPYAQVYLPYVGAWYAWHQERVATLRRTPQREAIWADLFVRPYLDSPELP